MRRFFRSVSLSLFGLGVGMSQASWAELEISDGYVRAMPPGHPATAAFLTIKNSGEKDIELNEATTDSAMHVEFHSHSMDEKGVMRMREEASVTVPAGGEFVFKTGGHHIMLMGLQKDLPPGEKIHFVLTDKQGKTYEFDLPVVNTLHHPKDQHSHNSAHQ